MRHDARIEERCGLKGVFVQEVGADQLPLNCSEIRIVVEGALHLVGPFLERREEIAMATTKAVERFGQDLLGSVNAERRDPINDPVGGVLVGLVAVPGLNRRLEGPHQHAGRVWAKLERLAA